MALTNWGHPRTYTDFPIQGDPSDALVLELTRGYAACVSYIDAQVGRVLDELDQLGLRDNTIVVLWGDHGWHLGENHIWGKATNFELSTRAPLIVSDPRAKALGRKTDALVEFVDIYPTLCELAGLPLPSHLDGRSFVSELKRPDHHFKDYVYSRYHAGESIITPRFVYTEWRGKNRESYARMLYDHGKDPKENANVSEDPVYAQVVDYMRSKLDEVRALTK
jgi:arylsulfatase A-like enzyme